MENASEIIAKAEQHWALRRYHSVEESGISRQAVLNHSKEAHYQKKLNVTQADAQLSFHSQDFTET